jgi:hypothetical protein
MKRDAVKEFWFAAGFAAIWAAGEVIRTYSPSNDCYSAGGLMQLFWPIVNG